MYSIHADKHGSLLLIRETNKSTSCGRFSEDPTRYLVVFGEVTYCPLQCTLHAICCTLHVAHSQDRDKAPDTNTGASDSLSCLPAQRPHYKNS